MISMRRTPGRSPEDDEDDERLESFRSVDLLPPQVGALSCGSQSEMMTSSGMDASFNERRRRGCSAVDRLGSPWYSNKTKENVS